MLPTFLRWFQAPTSLTLKTRLAKYKSCDHHDSLTRMRKSNFTSRIVAWLKTVPMQDPVDRQMASLLRVILLGFMTIILLAALINLLLPADYIELQKIFLPTFIFLLIIGIPLFLLRRGFFHGSVFVLIGLLLAIESFAVLTSNLRAIAETLTFYTVAILLAGLLVSRKALILTFAISAGSVLLSVFFEQDPALKLDRMIIAGNFILLNGLMSLFLDHFGATLHTALKAGLERENELNNEISVRNEAEAALQQFTERLEILHEIDRSLLSTHSLPDIAKGALTRVRQLIFCPRASVTLFDLNNHHAWFLAADFDGIGMIPDTPISLEEYGLNVIEVLKQNKPWFTDDMLKDPQVTELDKKLADQNGIHVWLSLPLLYQGQLIGALNLGRGPGQRFTQEDAEIALDIANQLAIALQQTRLYNALQDQLAEREKLIAQLEASNAELERFTYTVSHDLKNPLVTIKGFLGMLDKDLRENRQDKIQDDFKRIAGAADKMDALLSELLALSRIGRIANPPEQVDLAALTQEALETLDARLHSSHVTVNVSPDLPLVYGDRIRLREVLENLIDNAAKYMGNQTNPIIEIGVRQQERDPIIIIKDNGMGIEAMYHNRIFSLFEKLNPALEGTGIGLALVKRIVEVHGGRVWVESEGLGKGSTFCFTLPAKIKD
jgi:signal transduction histidine kinase